MNSLAAAGGIGGMLAVQDAGASQDYVYFHDALGSVGQVLDLAAPTAGAAMAAKYEYDPYGNQTGVAGGYEERHGGRLHLGQPGQTRCRVLWRRCLRRARPNIRGQS
jgi:hypothetical protein